MTCIVGVVDRAAKRVVLAADSLVSSGDEVGYRRDSKLFRQHGVVMGAAGDFRPSVILRHNLEFTPPGADDDEMAWMVHVFLESMYEALESQAWVATPPDGAMYLLVGVRHRLFFVDQDYCVLETTDDYAAIGSGAQYALGALAALECAAEGLATTTRANWACEAARRHCLGVGGPITTMATG